MSMPRRIGSGLLLAGLLAVTGCNGTSESENVNTTEGEDTLQSDTTLVAAEAPSPQQMAAFQREFAEAFRDCPASVNTGQPRRDVFAQGATLNANGTHTSELIIAQDNSVPAEGHEYELNEHAASFPYFEVRGKIKAGGGNNNAVRRVQLTITLNPNCPVPADQKLTLYEFHKGEWEQRARAAIPGDETIVAELRTLHSRFALGTW